MLRMHPSTKRKLYENLVFNDPKNVFVRLSTTSQKYGFNKFCYAKVKSEVNMQRSPHSLFECFNLAICASKCSKQSGKKQVV